MVTKTFNLNFFKNKRILILWVLIPLFTFIVGAVGSTLYFRLQQSKEFSWSQKKDVHREFLLEVYDKIKKNYWEKLNDKQLAELFEAEAENLTTFPQELTEKNKKGATKMIDAILKKMNKNQKKEFVTKLTDLVLVNLKPFGRSRLYTKKEEKNLQNRVNNVNPEKDLYKMLGADKDASNEAVQKAYEQKTKELEEKKEARPQVAEELKNTQYAYQVLSDTQKKTLYDQFGIEPTVFTRLITDDIVYLRIKQISPATFEEFQKVADGIGEKENQTSLILDLRGNVGGSIDILPYFLGPFIGQNQYAYEFFHQGVNQSFKTKTGWLASLVRYKKVVILVDDQTQSSAELMVAVLKKYNVGVVVGTRTHGWGTIENIIPLQTQLSAEEKYSVFLVHSLTLRDDNQPIEGNGVEPTVDINNPDWEKEFYAYFNYQELVTAVKTILSQKSSN